MCNGRRTNIYVYMSLLTRNKRGTGIVLAVSRLFCILNILTIIFVGRNLLFFNFALRCFKLCIFSSHLLLIEFRWHWRCFHFLWVLIRLLNYNDNSNHHYHNNMNDSSNNNFKQQPHWKEIKKWRRNGKW